MDGLVCDCCRDSDGLCRCCEQEFMALVNDDRGKVRVGETEEEREEKRVAKEREERRKAEAAAGKGEPQNPPSVLFIRRHVRVQSDRVLQRGGVANKATKLELTAEEKLERQTSQVGKIVRDAIKNNRSLGGQGGQEH